MDILSILGLLIAFGAILGGQVLEGGHIGSILLPVAFLIVMGGTLGAVMVQFPLPVFMKAMACTKMVFINPKVDVKTLITQIVELSNLSRKQGLLALEGKLKTISDPLLAKGVQLVVDGTEPPKIREILEVEVEMFEESHNLAAKVWESFGGYSPTIGILGAVLGLIHVMENLADPSKLGSGIAVAFVATVYGVGFANMVFLPFGGKIKMKTKEVVLARLMVIEGLVALAGGENPRMIEDKLSAYLPESERGAQPPPSKS